jgi:hypothetical protein
LPSNINMICVQVEERFRLIFLRYFCSEFNVIITQAQWQMDSTALLKLIKPTLNVHQSVWVNLWANEVGRTVHTSIWEIGQCGIRHENDPISLFYEVHCTTTTKKEDMWTRWKQSTASPLMTAGDTASVLSSSAFYNWNKHKRGFYFRDAFRKTVALDKVIGEKYRQTNTDSKRE